MARRIVDALEAISEMPCPPDGVPRQGRSARPHCRHGPAWRGIRRRTLTATIIVVDDVLNSGRTLLRVAHLLPFRPRHIAMCVLVDRIHRRFPVGRTVSMSLSTNLQARIDVRLSGPVRVRLSSWIEPHRPSIRLWTDFMRSPSNAVHPP